jgi:hypothetical protein
LVKEAEYVKGKEGGNRARRGLVLRTILGVDLEGRKHISERRVNRKDPPEMVSTRAYDSRARTAIACTIAIPTNVQLHSELGRYMPEDLFRRGSWTGYPSRWWYPPLMG